MLVTIRGVIRFLFSHRDTTESLGAWLEAFQASCLQSVFDREPTMSDEAIRFKNILDLCQEGNRLAGWSVPQLGGQGGSSDHLNLMTLHSAKGLEFDVVFLLGMEQGIIPSYQEKSEESKREPRRLFYVGLTRARYEVHMLYSGWYEAWGKTYRNGPSEFLVEVHRAITAE
jgi:DNA helicase-2/ATP-dependent DNA helicase PcrA